MKVLFVLSLLAMCSCTSTYSSAYEVNIKDELNASVMDGFFDNDSIKAKGAYFIK